MQSQESEDLLVQRAVERDKAAFTSLYNNYIDRVYKYAYYRVSNNTDAEDITQEVFIRAWKAIDKYKKTGAPFAAWLISITHNLIVDYYRARKKLVSLEMTETSAQTNEINPETIAEASLNKEKVREAIFKLKIERQKVVLMRFIDGLSYDEIARVLNKSEGAVRVIQYRALSDLRRILTQSE